MDVRRCCCSREQALGVLTAIGSYLLEFSFGYSNTIGNLNTYLIQHLEVTTSESIWFLGSTIVAKSIFTPIGELISQWVSYVGLLLATVIFCSGGIFLTMWSVNNGMVAFLFTNSVLFGIGIGLSFTITLKCTVAHYPQHSEAAVRIVGSAFGFGTIMFVPLQAIAIKVERLSDHPHSKVACSNVFLITGCVILAIQFIAFTFSFIAFWFAKEKQSRVDIMSLENTKRNFKEFVKKPETYILSVLNFLNVIPRMAIISTFKVYGQAVGFDATSLVIVATLNGIFNCVGYVIARVACSKASFKAPLILFLLLLTTLSGLFPLVEKIGLESFVLYVFCVFGLHFAMTAVNVVMTVANNAAIVPLVDFGTKLAFCFCSASSAIIFSIIASYQPIDRHYDIFFWFVASVGVLEIILALTMQDTACPLKLMRGRFFTSSKQEIKEADGQPEAGEGDTAP